MDKDAKIYLAGHGGMVGSALMRKLRAEGYNNLVTRSHRELDLTRQEEVETFFAEEKPEYVILAAARVGGINANMRYPAEFLTENLLIQSHVLNSAAKAGVKKLLFISSCCAYPRETVQPIPEEALLTGPLEPTNEGYGLAKICGLKACEFYNREYGTSFISVMPANLYGFNDNFDPVRAHVIPALIRRFHEAKMTGQKQATIWGRGLSRREFLFADDLADACCFLMNSPFREGYLNVGAGEDHTMFELAQIIKEVVGFEGKIETDSTKPEGMMRKFIDSSKINRMGWKPKTGIQQGLRLTYQWFLDHVENAYDANVGRGGVNRKESSETYFCVLAFWAVPVGKR